MTKSAGGSAVWDRAKQVAGACLSCAGSEQVSGAVDKAVETGVQHGVQAIQSGGDGPSASEIGNDVLSAGVPVLGALLGKAAAAALEKPEVEWSLADLEVNLQALGLEVSPAEEWFKNNSAICRPLVSGLAALAHLAPFGGGTLAAAILAVYSQAEQAAANNANCVRLIDLVKYTNTFAAKVLKRLHALSLGSTDSDSEDLKACITARIDDLLIQIRKVGQKLAKYCNDGFLRHFLTSQGDRTEFEIQHRDLQELLDRLHLDVTLALMHKLTLPALDKDPPPPPCYEDTSKELRSSIRAAAAVYVAADGVAYGEGAAGEALDALATHNPDKLRSLLEAKGFEPGVIQAEVQHLKAQVQDLILQVGDIRKEQQRLSAMVTGSSQVGPLMEWWRQTLGHEDYETCATVQQVADGLVHWFKDKGHVEDLDAWDDRLVQHGVLQGGLPRPPYEFIPAVVKHLLDADGNSYVTAAEVEALQMQIPEFVAKAAGRKQGPRDLLSFFNTISSGLDYCVLPKLDDPKLGDLTRSLDIIDDVLHARDTIRSYNVKALLSEYVQGTRECLYTEVNAWLRGVAPDNYADATSKSRAFLLLAGPGMGKSIFSAVMHTKLSAPTDRRVGVRLVRHFFKAGEPRAEGRAMLLSLAYQLAERLGHVMAGLLLAVTQKHGNGSNLSLDDLFDSFLLEPSQQFEKATVAAGGRLPVLLILLDALDESTHDGGGPDPVARLVARRFVELPLWVKLVLTSRPDTAAAFTGLGWEEQSIEPTTTDNQKDVKVLLRARLDSMNATFEEGRSRVVADVDAAVVDLVKKSRGELIYVKYLFEYLVCKKQDWTGLQLFELPEAEASQPAVYGAYNLFFEMIGAALKREGAGGADLLSLLTSRLLPVLAVSFEPLSLDLLAKLCNGGVAHKAVTTRVKYLLIRLQNLFPMRASVVYHYHKTVLDWLRDVPVDREASGSSFHVDAGAAHQLLASALAAQVAEGRSTSCNSAGRPPLDAYALKFTVEHLVQAIRASGQQQSTELTELLDTLLSDWDFLHDIMVARHGSRLLSALIRLPDKQRSTYTEDTKRWLGRLITEFDKWPDLMEQTTVRVCPVSSNKHKEAEERLGQPWRATQQLGGYGGEWPPDVVTIQATARSFLFASIAFNPDGTQLAIGRSDGQATLWSWDTATCTATLRVCSKGDIAVAYSPDGKQLATGDEHGMIMVWDLAMCARTAEFGDGRVITEMYGGVSKVAFRPDAKQLAAVHGKVGTARGAEVKLWDLDTRCSTATVSGWCFAYNQEGTLLATGGQGAVQVWDVANPSCTPTNVPVQQLNMGVEENVSTVAFSPDGCRLATCGVDHTDTSADTQWGWIRVVRVWDLATCSSTVVVKEKRSHYTCDIQFSPDGMRLATTGAQPRLWDLATATCIATLAGHEDTHRIAFSPDGRHLASGCNITVKVWDLAAAISGAAAQLPTGPHGVTALAFSPDGTHIAAGHGRGPAAAAKLWSLGATRCKATFLHATDVTRGAGEASRSGCDAIDPQRGYIKHIIFSPGGKQLATVGDTFIYMGCKLWSLEAACGGSAGAGCTTLPAGSGQGEDIRCFTLSPDLMQLAIAVDAEDANAVLQVWEGETCLFTATLQLRPSCIAFSPDGKQLATGFMDGPDIAKVWDLSRRSCMATLPALRVGGLPYTTFSHDGRVLATGTHPAPRAEGGNAYIAFSHDGSLLATGELGGPIQVWDLCQPVPSCITTLECRSNVCIQFSHDSKLLATVSLTGDVMLWEVSTSECILSLVHSEGQGSRCIAFSRDGEQLAVGFHDGTVMIWQRAGSQVQRDMGRAWAGDGRMTISGGQAAGHAGVARVAGGELVPAGRASLRISAPE